MSTPKFPPSLLPETQALLARNGEQQDVITDCLLEFLESIGSHPQITLGALASSLMTVLATLRLPDDQRARLVHGMRGVAATIVAYCDAPNAEEGERAIATAVAAANHAQFVVIDNHMATTVERLS